MIPRPGLFLKKLEEENQFQCSKLDFDRPIETNKNLLQDVKDQSSLE